MKIGKKSVVIASVVLVVVIILAIIYLNNKQSIDNPENTIGVILPLSGEMEVYGKESRRGVKIAVQHINELGGIDGQDLNVHFIDDEGSTDKSLREYKNIKKQGVPIIIGPIMSDQALVVAKKANEDNYPLLIPIATNPELLGFKNSVFKVAPLDNYQAKALSQTAKDRFWNRVAVIYDESSYGRGLFENFKEEFIDNYNEIVYTHSFSEAAPDFTEEMEEISELFKTEALDAMVFFGYEYELIHAIHYADDPDLHTNWLVSDRALYDELPLYIKGMTKEVIATHPTALVNSSVTDELTQDYKEFYSSSPLSISAYAYDSTLIAADALKKKGDLIKNLSETRVHGTTGLKTFHEDGNVLPSYDIWQVSDDKWKRTKQFIAR